MARSPLTPAAAAFRNKRLSVIAEDGSTNASSQVRNPRNKPLSPAQSPPYTPTASHRPESRQWMDQPPHHSADMSPPGYQHWNDDSPSSTPQRFMEKVRGNEQITRRGGWKRLLLIFIIIVILVIALALGLGVGLGLHNNGGDTPSLPLQALPEGNFSIPIFLANTSASCISESYNGAWYCFGGAIYSLGQNVNTGVNWVISAGDSNNPPQSYNISSSTDNFQDSFNVPLILQDKGTGEEEHYAFTATVVREVSQSQFPGSNNRPVTCDFTTIVSGALYTNKTNQNQNQTNAVTNGNWHLWPWAVSFNQTVSGGNNVSSCYISTPSGHVNTNSVPTVQNTSALCSCNYANYGFK